jgi:monofunctional biosynthetic peptidoglycan transglycosylase
VRILRLFIWMIAAWVSLTLLLVVALRWFDPPTSAFMIQDAARASSAKNTYEIRQRWVDWEDISNHAKIAVIAAEDQRFPQHFGFDLKSINEALDDMERGRRVRGASTISQQVAKNLFLWPGQSWIRKALEAYFTVLIELCWSKQRILEVYLNVAEFGRGIYGVSVASDAFFGKSAARINASEAALLAAVLPSPKRMRAANPSRYVRSRQAWILSQMRALGGTKMLTDLD